MPTALSSRTPDGASMAAALCRRGRFRVNCREVSLLPRHWDWLATQQGGASATLRRLVDEARKQSRQRDALRLAKDAGGPPT